MCGSLPHVHHELFTTLCSLPVCFAADISQWPGYFESEQKHIRLMLCGLEFLVVQFIPTVLCSIPHGDVSRLARCYCRREANSAEEPLKSYYTHYSQQQTLNTLLILFSGWKVFLFGFWLLLLKKDSQRVPASDILTMSYYFFVD